MPPVAAFATNPLMLREAAEYEKKCTCTQRIEAGRAELHRKLELVLVVDMRMSCKRRHVRGEFEAVAER